MKRLTIFCIALIIIASPYVYAGWGDMCREDAREQRECSDRKDCNNEGSKDSGSSEARSANDGCQKDSRKDGCDGVRGALRDALNEGIPGSDCGFRPGNSLDRLTDAFSEMPACIIETINVVKGKSDNCTLESPIENKYKDDLPEY